LCKLKYYYNYVGKWEGFKGQINREKLQWLSRKKCWYMVQGSLIHEAIEGQINQWAVGRPVSKDAAKNLFSFQLREIQQAPRESLIDEINGFPVDTKMFDESSQNGPRLLDGFFDIIWPNYEPLQYVKHEEFDSFDVNGVRVWTKIDLVTRMKDKTIVVTDWKTGKVGETDENEDQLTTYVLWAMHRFRIDEKSVRAEVRYLRDTASRPRLVQVDKEQLQEFRKMIAKESNEMLSVKSVSDFPSSPSSRCRECAYATICASGHQFIPSSSRGTPIPVVAS
jgi:CRISPR/Cas system-associated exonuclease Cas4 (RecB family)